MKVNTKAFVVLLWPSPRLSLVFGKLVRLSLIDVVSALFAPLGSRIYTVNVLPAQKKILVSYFSSSRHEKCCRMISQQNTLMNNYTAKMSLVPDD